MLTIGLVLACIAFAAATAEPAHAQATVAPPLTGQTFFAGEGEVILGIGVPPVGTINVTANCNATPPTISYTVSGDTFAPYPGTYSETGTATLAGTLGPVTGFQAHFTIDSAVGFVEGDKQLSVGQGGACQSTVANRLHHFSAEATYSAVVTTASGACRTEGTALVALAEFDARLNGTTQVQRSFGENFTSGTPCLAVCPPNNDEDNDGLTDNRERAFFTLLGNADSDLDGIADGNDDANGNGEDDEDEDDDENDGCPDEDSDGDGEDDEDEDDDEDDDD